MIGVVFCTDLFGSSAARYSGASTESELNRHFILIIVRSNRTRFVSCRENLSKPPSLDFAQRHGLQTRCVSKNEQGREREPRVHKGGSMAIWLNMYQDVT